MKNKKSDVTTVIDAGARYGMHPSWNEFGGNLCYYAFEPDFKEAARLRAMKHKKGFKVIGAALDQKKGTRKLYVTKHRGYCSFLETDSKSDWFSKLRPGENQLESIAKVKTLTIDGFAKSKRAPIDFLKIDVEGADLDVLKGGKRELKQNVLGIRIGIYFQACYKKQCFFTDIHEFLLDHGFFLLNLDYFGKGVPRNFLFRNPDPFAPDYLRYGTLVSTDGVWLKKSELLPNDPFVILKYAYFCMLNHAPDVAIDTLLHYVQENPDAFDPSVTRSLLYKSLRRMTAIFLGRWRVYPDKQWQEIQSMYKTIFGIELESGSKFWEMIGAI